MKLTTITAVLAEIKETKEIYCKQEQSQASLSYAERSRNSLSKNALEFIAHVILKKQSRNAPKGAMKKLQESSR